MALPDTRNTTYAPGSMLLSADMNDLQDKVIDEHFNGDGKLPAIAGKQTTGTTGTFNAEGSYIAGINTDVLSIPIPVRPNTRLVAVRARVTDEDDFGTGTITLDVRKSTDGSSASLGTATSLASGVPEDVDVTGLTEDIDVIGTPDVQYIARFTFAGSLVLTVHGIEWETAIVP